MDRADSKAIIGMVTSVDPDEFIGRSVFHDGDRLGGEIQRQYGKFNDPEKLARFLLSKHWLRLVGKDWSKDPVNVLEADSAEEDAPIDLGEYVDVFGSAENVEGFTQDSNMWFADWLYLIHLPLAELSVYRPHEGSWTLVDTIPLKPAKKLRAAEKIVGQS